MPIPFLVAKFFLNLRVYELLALPHSLLPTSRHETAVSRIYYPNQHIIYIGTWEYSLRYFAVLLTMDRSMSHC